MGAVEVKQTNPSSNSSTGAKLTQNAGPGNSSPAASTSAGRRLPIDCGDLDMRIARDGTWFYNGTPIGRPALVRLFSTILRREPDRAPGSAAVAPAKTRHRVLDDAPPRSEPIGFAHNGSHVDREKRFGPLAELPPGRLGSPARNDRRAPTPRWRGPDSDDDPAGRGQSCAEDHQSGQPPPAGRFSTFGRTTVYRRCRRFDPLLSRQRLFA